MFNLLTAFAHRRLSPLLDHSRLTNTNHTPRRRCDTLCISVAQWASAIGSYVDIVAVSDVTASSRAG